MRKRLLATSLAALLAATSLTACGSKTENVDTATTEAAAGASTTKTDDGTQTASGDKVTLNICWWGNQTRNDVTKKSCGFIHE
uniref:hypothetical protein n=1 Tax=Clostridium sp. NkU-1 TaxID=1095009 RepID=UPI000B131A57